MPLEEQELLILPDHLCSLSVVSGACVTPSLVLCVCFVDRCLSFYSFSLSFLSIVLSDLLRFTDSDYPFGILIQILLIIHFCEFNVILQVHLTAKCKCKYRFHNELWCRNITLSTTKAYCCLFLKYISFSTCTFSRCIVQNELKLTPKTNIFNFILSCVGQWKPL